MKIKIGDLYNLYQKYGDLGFKVNTPYGYKNIEWCGITEKNAEVYRCELENGMFVEGADYHKLKNTNNQFVVLKEIKIGESIQTINGDSKVSSVELLDIKDDLYDIQVAEVHQYYTNGIVSHNTVLTVDLLLFLFFNETTKTSKAEEVFNRFSNKDKVHIKGEIIIDGDEYVIVRNIERKKKKDGEWNVKTELDFFKKLSDGTLQNFTGEQRRETESFIKTSIGTKEDFLMTILTTATNLEELIDSKPTARGQVLSRFMGLDFIKKKEDTGKEIYSEFSKSMLSNVYSSEKLKSDNDGYKERIEVLQTENITQQNNLIDVQNRIIKGQEYRDTLLKSKHTDIDVEISNIVPERIESEIIGIKTQKQSVEIQLKELKVVEPTEFYSEQEHDWLKDEHKHYYKKIVLLEQNIKSIESLKSSVDGGIKCEHCGIELMMASITQSKIAELDNYIIQKTQFEGEMTDLIIREAKYVLLKKEFDEYEKNKLIKEKYELTIEGYVMKIKGLEDKLEKFNLLQDKISTNNKIEIQLIKANLRLDELDREKTSVQRIIRFKQLSNPKFEG
jgi:hypothetical protein